MTIFDTTKSLSIVHGHYCPVMVSIVMLSVVFLLLCWVSLCRISWRPSMTMCSWVKRWGGVMLRAFMSRRVRIGNTKGGSITVPLASCLTGLDKPVLHIKTKIVSCHTADSKPVKQEVNSIVILPPSVFPGKNATYVALPLYPIV